MDIFWLSDNPPTNAEDLFNKCMKYSNTLFHMISNNTDVIALQIKTKSSKMTLL